MIMIVTRRSVPPSTTQVHLTPRSLPCLPAPAGRSGWPSGPSNSLPTAGWAAGQSAEIFDRLLALAVTTAQRKSAFSGRKPTVGGGRAIA